VNGPDWQCYNISNMKKTIIIWIVIAVVILVGAWYVYSNISGANKNQATNVPSQQNTYSNATATPPQKSTLVATPLLVATSSPTLGSYLAALNGYTVYTYSKDASGVSNCNGQCAVIWSPYILPNGVSLIAAAGVNGKLGEITRTDSSTQLTYNGKPLYFFDKDLKAGDTNGQGVGGVWYVVKL